MNKYDATKFFDKTQYILEKKKERRFKPRYVLKKGCFKSKFVSRNLWRKVHRLSQRYRQIYNLKIVNI